MTEQPIETKKIQIPGDNLLDAYLAQPTAVGVYPGIVVLQEIFGVNAAGITTRTPGGGKPTISRTPEIKGTIYTFFGNEDTSIPPEQVDEIVAEFAKYNISHRVFRYDGSEHGFFCDCRASYNPKAAADAWQQVQQLFSQLL